jgi:hypothetical protein
VHIVQIERNNFNRNCQSNRACSEHGNCTSLCPYIGNIAVIKKQSCVRNLEQYLLATDSPAIVILNIENVATSLPVAVGTRRRRLTINHNSRCNIERFESGLGHDSSRRRLNPRSKYRRLESTFLNNGNRRNRECIRNLGCYCCYSETQRISNSKMMAE